MKRSMSDGSLQIELSDPAGAADGEALREAVAAALASRGVTHAELDVAVVHDAEMHALNRRWLAHDYTTDVLSFPLGGDGTAGDPLSGQVIVNPDYAAREAATHNWPSHERPAATRELMLYAAHGTLHVCGLDDQTDEQRAEMRRAEAAALAACGVNVPVGHVRPPAAR